MADKLKEQLEGSHNAFMMYARHYTNEPPNQDHRAMLAHMLFVLAGMIKETGSGVSDVIDRIDKLDRDIAELKSGSGQQPRR